MRRPTASGPRQHARDSHKVTELCKSLTNLWLELPPPAQHRLPEGDDIHGHSLGLQIITVITNSITSLTLTIWVEDLVIRLKLLAVSTPRRVLTMTKPGAPPTSSLSWTAVKERLR